MKFWDNSRFKSGKNKTIDINGYIIDENTMEIINEPDGLDINKIPHIENSI